MRVTRTFVTMLAILGGYAQVQEVTPAEGATPYSATARTVEETDVRNRPPYGLFRMRRGTVIATLEPDTPIEIVARRSYSGFEGTHVWYQIKPIDAADTDDHWWVDAGVGNERLTDLQER